MQHAHRVDVPLDLPVQELLSLSRFAIAALSVPVRPSLLSPLEGAGRKPAKSPVEECSKKLAGMLRMAAREWHAQRRVFSARCVASRGGRDLSRDASSPDSSSSDGSHVIDGIRIKEMFDEIWSIH